MKLFLENISTEFHLHRTDLSSGRSSTTTSTSSIKQRKMNNNNNNNNNNIMQLFLGDAGIYGEYHLHMHMNVYNNHHHNYTTTTTADPLTFGHLITVNWRPPDTSLHYQALYRGIYEFLREPPHFRHVSRAVRYLRMLKSPANYHPSNTLQRHRILWTQAWLDAIISTTDGSENSDAETVVVMGGDDNNDDDYSA
jgi:hypothetical protein